MRGNDDCPGSLSVADLRPLAHKLAYRHQRRPGDHDDLVQAALCRYIDYVHGLDGPVENPPALARRVFQTAMQGFYLMADEREGPATDRIQGPEPEFGRMDERLGEIYVEEFMEAARQTLPALAYLILTELHDPSPAVIEEARSSSRGGRVRVGVSHIQRAHDITSNRAFSRHLKRLRAFARSWFDLDEETAA